MKQSELLKQEANTEFNCIVAITQSKQLILIKSNPSLYEIDLIEYNECELELTNQKDIPKEEGIYSCIIEVQSWQDNTPDSCDWNLEMYIKDARKLETNLEK